MSTRFTGKYFTFKIKGRKFNISGVVLSYNDAYTLIQTFEDFTADGYMIFKNHNVEYYVDRHVMTARKILKVKQYRYNHDLKVPMDSLDSILSFVSKKYQLIQLNTLKGDACDVVRYLGQEGRRFVFEELTTTAKWRYKLKFQESQCRFITFDNNYLNSLKLITTF